MITLPLLLVAIDRGDETVTTKVPEHEIPILKVVHGQDAVSVEDEETHEEIELDEGAESEFRRLQRKYRRINAPDLVVRAFPQGAKELSHAGFKTGRDGKSAEPPQSAARIRPPASKAAGKAAKSGQSNADSEAEKAAAEKAAIVAELDKLEAKYDGRSGVDKLRELLEAEKAKRAGN
jgi:hypothetical protein